jgi:hypothetical protein
MNDQVGGADHRIVSVRSNTGVHIAIEGVCIERAIVGDFRTHLDLRRKPVLPAARNIHIARLNTGALALHVVIPFRPEGEVVQLVRRVIEIGQEGLRRRSTCESRRVVALRKVRCVERYEIWAERCAAAGNNCHRRGIEGARHVVLVQVVCLEREVPVVVELVIECAAEPLQIVVTPLTAVDGISDEVEVIPAVIARPR